MRRKRRKWIALVMALVSGGAAGWLALNHLDRPLSPKAATASESSRVVVAARDLELGRVLTSADVKVVDWPARFVPPGYAGTVDAVVGRGLIQHVSANEPLLAAKLATKEEGGGLPIVIPEGKRAVSVKVDEVIGVAGFIRAGTRVDVLVTLNPTNEREEAASRLVLQNVQVLAAGQEYKRDVDGEPQTVTVITLLVSPEEAETLTLSSTEGRIQLALRNTLDQAEVETDGVKAKTLVGAAVVAPAPRTARRSSAPVSRGTTIVTYNGDKRTETTF
ncbi:MAG: Flp pilus assembly protein CpaB [Gemmatimonadetes bacterium]|nr:Flp pilus assembly protein CpaB [Gemmatimonadota bacterium]